MTHTSTNTAVSEQHLDEGRQHFEEVFGYTSQAFEQRFNELAPNYGRDIIAWEFSDAYRRPGLDLRTRELAIIAACAALGAIGHPTIKMHVPAALRAGATREEICEVLVQVGFAAGLPASLGALAVAREAILDFIGAQS
ncbi:4-carboxymuconolactone decarboxylase [Pseudomonas sp. JUb42]|jgi:4-carboxymuconolactone decarboxylase|uniref:carboxymuconolactone decarboxylase family protein n=1 Tax=Pseudomonas sp. JUb42 TaxID=2940611 RepID=UPI002169E5D1|nr:carboxymuconolactone decarboxylase family protein [Pseudomonas sp. JUb42]MCS3468908.1 4-carboxymuconolactone decarboxylase [Pseudomonas sp. JUb42]